MRLLLALFVFLIAFSAVHPLEVKFPNPRANAREILLREAAKRGVAMTQDIIMDKTDFILPPPEPPGPEADSSSNLENWFE